MQKTLTMAVFGLVGQMSWAALAQMAPAAEAAMEADGLGEIIVTARRRSESLQNTPIAVTALSTADLEKRSAINIGDAAQYVPNLHFTPGQAGGGGTAQLFIRGVGQQDFLITNDPGVGIYLDGVFIARSPGSLIDVLDLERLEVLRGPQGTLFGRNTVAGALNLVSLRPAEAFGGYAEITTGRFNRLDGRLSISVPLSPKLRSRATLASINRDGFGVRLTDGLRLGNQSALVGRFVLEALPTDTLTLSLSVDGTRRREESLPQSLVATRATPLLTTYNNVVGRGAGTTMGPNQITGDLFATNASGESLSNVDVWGSSLTAEWRGDDIALKSITGYREMQAAFARDNDNSPLPYFEVTNRTEQSQFSQEFQLSGSAFDDRLTYLFGVFYFQESATDNARVRIAEGTFPAIRLDLSRRDDNRIDTKSYAVFGEATYRLLPTVRLTLGGRINRDEKRFRFTGVRPFSGVFIVPPTDVSDDWTSFTPRAILDWRPVDSAMVYASVSRGFKAGGFNGRPDAAIGVTPYEPETLTTYEVGFKAELLDRRLRINAAAFTSDYNDIQTYFNDTRPDGSFFLTISNASRARIRGFEVEVTARPFQALTLNGAVGHTDARYLEVPRGVPFTVNSRFFETPAWTATLGGELAGEIGSIGRASLRADWSYRSRVFHDVQNSPEIATAPYSLVNARLTWTPPIANDALDLAVFATNLFNERYIQFGVSALANLGVSTVQPGRPREWGVSARLRF